MLLLFQLVRLPLLAVLLFACPFSGFLLEKLDDAAALAAACRSFCLQWLFIV